MSGLTIEEAAYLKGSESKRRPGPLPESDDDVVRAAESGDRDKAIACLQNAASFLEARRPMPDALADYLAVALRKMAGDPVKGEQLPPLDAWTLNTADEIAGGLAEEESALDAFHLRRRGRPDTEERDRLIVRLIRLRAAKHGETLTEAKRATADQLGLSDYSIKRIWETYGSLEKPPRFLGLPE